MDEVNRQAAAVPARRILAFDCSGASCSAAVLDNGQVAARRFATMMRGQAEVLVPMIGEVMTNAGLSYDVLDAVVTTAGPGSFTGIRLGLAAAQGIALAAARPLLAVSSFEAYLAGLSQPDRQLPVAVAIDSRRGPVFLQIFDAGRRAMSEPLQVDPDRVAAHLPSGHVMLTGDAMALLKDHVDPASIILPADAVHIDAAHLAMLAGGLLSWQPVFRAPVPLYLRPPDVTAPKSAP
jgi:tRNA threonylcarbamoyladenosine biosynthesis protein TsaB